MAARCGFPWLHSHGPIEAVVFRVRFLAAEVDAFPWLHSHGPIEALAFRADEPHDAYFRGYTATAPLKLNLARLM